MLFTKRLIAALGTFVLFVLAVLAAQNIESISAHLRLNAIGVDGPPQEWRAAAMSLWGEWAVPAVSLVAGPFGLGFVLAAFLFSAPDFVSAMRRLQSQKVHSRRLGAGSLEGIALRELQVIKAVRLKAAFEALAGMIGGFGNMAMVGRDETDKCLIRLAMECQDWKYEAVRPALDSPLHQCSTVAAAKDEIRELIRDYSEFYRDAEKFHNVAHYNIADTSGIDGWKAAHREFVTRFREAVRTPMLDDLRELADGLPLYESSMPAPSKIRSGPESATEVETGQIRSKLRRLVILLAGGDPNGEVPDEIKSLWNFIRFSSHPAWDELQLQQWRDDFLHRVTFAEASRHGAPAFYGSQADRDRILTPINDLAMKIDTGLANYGAS